MSKSESRAKSAALTVANSVAFTVTVANSAPFTVTVANSAPFTVTGLTLSRLQ